MSKWFAISDLHFDHNRIIQYCSRPFSSVEEMNEKLIQNWNSKVKAEDMVVVAGDFSISKSKEKIANILRRLNGNKILTLGNHDYLSPLEYLEAGFSSVYCGPFTFCTNNHFWVVSHYRMATWEQAYKGSFHLFGHSHWNRQIIPDHLSCKKLGISEKTWNICVEANDYTPIELSSLVKILEKRNSNSEEQKRG